MNFIFQKKRGSFLVDIMVAMGILTMSITASLTLINQSITTNSVNKNKVIAVNLAREGLEGVRAIRDTNWSRYGTKKRICWNFWNNTNQDDEWSHSSDEICQEGEITGGVNGVTLGNSGYNIHPIGVSIMRDLKIGIKSYILHFDETNYNWILVENFQTIPDNWTGNINDQIRTCSNSAVTTIHVTGLDDARFMNLDACSNTDNNDGKWNDRKVASNGVTSRLYKNIDGFYTHKQAGNTETDFYREIFIEYPLGEEGFHPILSEENIDTMKAIDNQILVTVNVWYRGHGGIMRKVTLETEFTDYLERTNWSE